MQHALRPTSLPQAVTYDFANPESDGADICWYATLTKNVSSTNATPQSTLQIDYGVDFYWTASTLQGDVTSAGSNAQTESSIQIPMVNVHVQDGASGKNLENIVLPSMSECGAGERPYVLLQPRVIRGGTILVFVWRAIVAANVTYNNLYLVLHGYTRPAS